MDKDDLNFPRLTNTLNHQARSLQQIGVGEKRHCSMLNTKSENKLWDSKVMGIHSPKALLKCSFLFEQVKTLY